MDREGLTDIILSIYMHVCVFKTSNPSPKRLKIKWILMFSLYLKKTDGNEDLV